jgi:hypothetical protein
LQAVTSLLLVGFGIGISISVIGGVVDYWLSGRKNNPHQSKPFPGCLLYIAGALVLIGLVALVISFILEGSIRPAIILGAGVLSGFYAGFTLLMLLYLFTRRFWSRPGG